MIELETARLLLLLLFGAGYLAIIFETPLKINKSATALLMAVLTWTVLFLAPGSSLGEKGRELAAHLNQVSQIIFFLLGAMTLVELIDAHGGFKIVTDLIQTSSKRKLLWLMGAISFFLSAVLDNLTTTLVMVSLLRKLIPETKDRLLLGAIVIIAANAGGAWTPIGDVTTTMLWINGNITTLKIMASLFLPSLASCAVALFFLGWNLKGNYERVVERAHEEKTERGARLVFFLGVGGLIFVPIFKTLTGLPPFMGILVVLGALWFVTDILHSKHIARSHLRVPHILTRIDTSGILFFLGILLSIGSLDAIGTLRELAEWLNRTLPNLTLIATLIGLLSAVVDNVPLVAAGMGMYDLPTDAPFWQMLAYAAGTGGSILVIGSAAGIAWMGMEKIDFVWYLRRISFVALISYLAGMGVYLLQSLL